MKIDDIGEVRQLTLDRPQRRNALGDAMMRDLSHALQDADGDPDVRAIVLNAEPPAFCSGSDLKELRLMSVQEMCRHELATAQVARSIAGLSKPVIVAVEGYALGGGFLLALSCDVVVTASNARWHLPEVPNGWLPPWGLHTLVARTGVARARLLTWATDPIDGTEAHRLGVADYVTGPQQADAAALALAQKLAALPPEAVTSCKRFFESFASLDGERLDRLATLFFETDAKTRAAQATLAKFRTKPQVLVN